MTKKIFSILALLAMTVSGAWADDAKYALTTGDSFTSGQTVEVKDDAEAVVATITYGESGGADFKAAKETTAASALTGYTAYTEGNGTNGDKTGGTFYTIVPAYDGTIDVAVILNADKAFYILEDGTALEGYNGIKVDAKYYGTYSFSVSAGKSYKFYCAASKLGFYGFEYTYTAPFKVTPTANANEWTFAMPAFDVQVNVEYETALALDEAEDNAATLDEWDGYEADVTLTRTLQTGGWNTLALPFNVEATTLAAINAKLAMMSGSMTVKELTGSSFENGTLTLTFGDATSIEAGKPYLVKVTPAAVNLATMPFTGAEVSKTAESVETTDVDFVPTLGKTTITGDDAKTVLFLAADNKLKNPTALPTDMKGFRAYFQLKGAATSARSFNLNLGDEATGINAVNGSEFMGNGSEVYDLQGRRVSGTAQKGVYVVNGKKTVIK